MAGLEVLHVEAKRCLVARKTAYAAKLAADSVASLAEWVEVLSARQAASRP